MKLSLNWIKQYTKVDLSVDELVQKIGAQLGEIEAVEALAPKYKGATIVKVVSSEDHPNADRLHVCVIDDGGKTPDVSRDENGNVQVVCGAPNVRAGMLAVWLPPGSTVPESYGKEPFALEARELRGVISNGMLASAKELSLGDNHEGIVEVDPEEWSPKQSEIKPGASFAAVFGLDDTIIDIENKMFTHRPDLFGELGLAREVAGITHQAFVSPKWYTEKSELSSGSGLSLAVTNEAPEVVPRLMVVAIKNVEVKPSPLWLQCELIRVGQKPINNIVDATNYIMLLTAQPTHAYDYDKLRGGSLVARFAKPDEQVRLLNNKTYTLDPADIVIADSEGAVGLAGVMGGGDSEVSLDTKNIVLECANFDMYAVRRSSMRHGVFTDALTRFNKGQSPLQNANVLQLLVQSIIDVAGGEVASEVFDVPGVGDREWVHPPVPITAEFINARLGLSLKAEEMQTLLGNVEMKVSVDGDSMTVTAPFWRTDLESREDIVEEVGRLHGYDKLPLELPKRSIRPAAKNQLAQLKQRVRGALSAAGANEVLTYSFVHGDLLEKAGQDASQAFCVSNALSPDLQYFRLSLTPSLLEKVHPNIKAGYDQFALYEIGKAHNINQIDEDGLPLEFEMLDLVYAASDKAAPAGAAFYQARTYLDTLMNRLGVEIELRPFDAEEDYAVAKPYDHTRSAKIFVRGTDKPLGMLGEYKTSVRRALKLPAHSAGFGIGLEQLLDVVVPAKTTYLPLQRFPSVTQDLTLRVASSTLFGDVARLLATELRAQAPEHSQITLDSVGAYQSPDDTEHKNLTFRITITAKNRTLTESEVTKTVEALATAAQAQVGGERV
jgi:phenylalanyl-tRNA synthetase beta chain